MSALRYLCLFLGVIPLCGCQPFGLLGKRASERHCPTDIRQKVACFPGEDAIFSSPCGPDQAFYGYKPTCWSVWPAPGAEWRDAGCGPLQQDHFVGERVLGEPIPNERIFNVPPGFKGDRLPTPSSLVPPNPTVRPSPAVQPSPTVPLDPVVNPSVYEAIDAMPPAIKPIVQQAREIRFN